MSDWTFSVCCCCFGDQKSVWLDQIPGNPAQPRVTVEKWSKNFDERPHCHRGSTNFFCGKIALCGLRTIPPPPYLFTFPDSKNLLTSAFLAGGGFFRSLLWARVQPTVDASTETLYRSSVLAQERRGIGRCMRVYA